MLVEFSVANYRSIKDRVTLSLVASGDTTHLENTFVPEGVPSRLRLLKSAAVYGANASGKSNLVGALMFVERFVRTSARERGQDDPIPVTPFRLDPKTLGQPSEFEVVFLLGGKRYEYGFAADSTSIRDEWLTVAEKKPALLFRRRGQDVKFGRPGWKGAKTRLVSLMRPNALFLSVAAQFNHETAQAVVNSFRDSLRFVSQGPSSPTDVHYTMNEATRDPNFRADVVEFMRVADLGITGLRVEQRRYDEEESTAGMDSEAREFTRNLLKSVLAALGEKPPEHVLVAHSMRKGIDGSDVLFDLLSDDESAGTRRLFALSGRWLYVLRKGCVLVVDELESKLHPKISRFLVEQIHRSQQSQLVFTTQDSFLLDPDLFRRDQIWFTEKDKAGVTDLYSLSDIKADVRKDEDFRTKYLKGRYGAIPVVGEFRFAETKG